MADEEKIVTIDDESITDKASIARILGLSVRRIEQLAQDGVIVPVVRGKYAIGDTIRRYIKKLTDNPVDEEDIKLDKNRRIAETAIKANKAAMAKIQLAEMQGKMYREEDIAAVTEDLIYAFRGALMALPGRISMDLVGIKTAAEAAQIVQAETHKIMRELAQYEYDPKVYQARINARNQLSDSDYDE